MQQEPAGERPGLSDLLAGVEAPATVLFVHAHPDDESIATGGTMAALAAAGHRVLLLTCTRGELGEVIPADLRHLQVGLPESVDDGTELARVRLTELASATRVLGVHSGFLLGTAPALASGAPSRLYRDSGMSWGEDGRARPAPQVSADSFSQQPLEQSTADAAALLRVVRPDVVVTYDDDGGYGHPDHIRTHEVTLAALAQVREELPIRLWVTASDAGSSTGRLIEVAGDPQVKRAAIAAHGTQAVVEGGRFALSNGIWRDVDAVERFRSMDTTTPPAPGRRRRGGGIGAVLAAVVAGLLVCWLGTVLQGHVGYTGATPLPWGAVLAIVLCASAATAVGVWTRSVWAAALTGAVAFTANWLLAGTGEVPLIVTQTAQPTGIALAGLVWLYGAGVATIAAVLFTARGLRRSRT
ncbi:PIG-L family deacetylase [Tersicoccus sp. MR15.9]|uniref:PIG-L family deacetylase n=1 Tax=Tersicoccus mangrovi TaxID=3121635 RepID=UPI002FE56C38